MWSEKIPLHQRRFLVPGINGINGTMEFSLIIMRCQRDQFHNKVYATVTWQWRTRCLRVSAVIRNFQFWLRRSCLLIHSSHATLRLTALWPVNNPVLGWLCLHHFSNMPPIIKRWFFLTTITNWITTVSIFLLPSLHASSSLAVRQFCGFGSWSLPSVGLRLPSWVTVQRRPIPRI